MLYSKTAHQNGLTGFFFEHDINAPHDSFLVSDNDAKIAVNLPLGSSYDFTVPSNGESATLVTTSPTNEFLLGQAQIEQISALNAAYNTAIIAPVSYTTKAGTTSTFNQSVQDKQNLQNAIAGSLATQNWSLNIWLNQFGQSITPFTFADLEGLAAAMEAADIPDFVNLLSKIAQVQQAATIQEVQAVNF